MKKYFIIFSLLALIFLMPGGNKAQGQDGVVINSAMAKYKDPVEAGDIVNYQMSLTYSDQEPDYVRVHVGKMFHDNGSWSTYNLAKQDHITEFGWAYTYKKTFSANELGCYGYYFEVKVGDDITTTSTVTGPKVASSEIINNHHIYLFNKDQSSPAWSFNMKKKWATSVAISADGNNIAAASNKRKFYRFNNDSNKPLWKYKGKKAKKKGSAMWQDRGLVAMSNNDYLAASAKGWVYLFNLNKKKPRKPVWKRSNGKALYALAISEDGRYIAAGGLAGRVYLWSKDRKKPIWTKKISNTSSIQSIDMTPDGKYISVGMGSPDNRIYIFNTESSEPTFNIKAGNNFSVLSNAISDNGQYLMASGGTGTDKLIYEYSSIFVKIGETTPLWTFGIEHDQTFAAAISPSGQHAALAFSYQGLFVLEDTHGPGSTKWWLRYPGYITSMEYSDNGQYLAAGSGTNRVYLLNYDGSQFLRNWKVDNKVESVAISEDGQYIVAGTSLFHYMMLGESNMERDNGSVTDPLTNDPGPEHIDFDNFSFY
ncbi:MAG: WD40 repeat domain-containing protein [Patescibacteria group bacterium]